MTTQALPIPVLGKVPRTPFYLYSESHLRCMVEAARAAFPSYVRVHFALKSNHNPKVLQLFGEHGFGVDLVSGGELAYALEHKFEAKKMVLSGVGKSVEELEVAIAAGVGLINVESEFELDDVVEVARRLKKKAKIGFRLNPDVDAKTHPYISTGLKAHKFGISFEHAREILKRVPELGDAVEICGLSMHIGSQIKDLSAIREASLKLLHEALKWVEAFPTLKTLDLGGGLGISYEDPSSMADFDGYAKILREVGDAWQRGAGPSAVVALELGRCLVAQAGYLFTRVLGTKHNHGSNFCVVDASMTELMRPSLYQAYHHIVPNGASKGASKGAMVIYDVVGPVCESSDVLGRARELPEQKKGDVLVICSAGAYGYVLSNIYNMRQMPAEYWLDESGKLDMVRRSLDWSEVNRLTAVKGEQ